MAITLRLRHLALVLGGISLLALLALTILAPRPAPASANPLTGVSQVSAGVFHSCAVTATGNAKCWGNNFFGQLGDGGSGPGSSRTTPVDVIYVGNNVAAISLGGLHTCALTTAGAVVCWGNDWYRQLGLGDVNGDSFVNSIDATLVLQFDAGILESLEHPELADVNADSSVNSLDAQLVLQYDAGLVQNLN